MRKLRLQEYSNVNAGNEDSSININMSNDTNIIRESEFNEEINLYNVYLDEREDCTKIRLTAQVNLIASNPLFNYITEVVKNEDSNICQCLNFTPTSIATTYGKAKNYKWGSDQTELVRDTQITSKNIEHKNYTYNCGIDIFNNHVLRSKNSIPAYYKKNASTSAFNTISDLITDKNGFKKKSAAYNTGGDKYLHVYTKDNILPYIDCINTRLQTSGGWFGFVNRSKMSSYDESTGKDFEISRVINNIQVNSFIDLYPGRSHFSMLSYYNKKRRRQEKNWEYCLTYPYSATTEGIPTINQHLGTLRISHIDENTINSDDLSVTVVYSLGKHGLAVDDVINIYRSNEDETKSEIIESNVIVDSIIDDYTFSVYLSDNICDEWVSIYDNDIISGGTIFSSHEKGSDKYYYDNGSKWVKPFNDFINADFDSDSHIGSQNLSFARVVDNEECKYYARIFSRFPNFEFWTGEVDRNTIYSKGNGDETVIEEFSHLEYEKQSTLTKLAFSKNAYGDDLTQIVYNDDIDINYIQDNLGRPLTSLYLSFFKTNYGRKEWYGSEGCKSNSVEHSHCFGKLNCGLNMNVLADSEKYSFANINVMNNIDDGYEGLDLQKLGGTGDELIYKNQDLFYGDICEYSETKCLERVLQPVLHRFNTQQRELANSGLQASGNFTSLRYDEISSDDYDTVGFSIDENVFDATPTAKREGYYYISNHEIPIRTFSEELNEYIPYMHKLFKLEKSDDVYIVTTIEENYFDMESNVYLYDKEKKSSYGCQLINILSPNTVSLKIIGGDEAIEGLGDISKFRLYKKSLVTPYYAKVSTDGSGKIKWRRLLQNGFEPTEGAIPEYPFVNGCLYVNKQINLYLRRQDPFNYFGLNDCNGIEAVSGSISKTEDENNTTNESEATC